MIRRIREAFGIGVDSDKQLKDWAIEREHYNGEAFHAALDELLRLGHRNEAIKLCDKFPFVTRRIN